MLHPSFPLQIEGPDPTWVWCQNLLPKKWDSTKQSPGDEDWRLQSLNQKSKENAWRWWTYEGFWEPWGLWNTKCSRYRFCSLCQYSGKRTTQEVDCRCHGASSVQHTACSRQKVCENESRLCVESKLQTIGKNLQKKGRGFFKIRDVAGIFFPLNFFFVKLN